MKQRQLPSAHEGTRRSRLFASWLMAGIVTLVWIGLRDGRAESNSLVGGPGISQESTNKAPVANAGPEQAVECISHTGTPVTLNGSASIDPDGGPLKYEWKNSAGQVIGTAPTVSLRLPLGKYTFSLTVIDRKGGTATSHVNVRVRDSKPPSLNVNLSSYLLWPPSHQFVPIRVGVEVSDVCDPSPKVTLVSISSSEPDSPPGATTNDVHAASYGTDDRTFLLRAERSAKGRGRVYTVRYRAVDASGNTTFATAQAVVPQHWR
jgi:hypothetical protein